MRWRFVDRIDAFEPWVSIKGRKGISLEEYSLLERFGRKGVLPESLMLESCIQFARWLVIVSSGFVQSAMLTEISEFVYHSEASMGDSLNIVITAKPRDERSMTAICTVYATEQHIAGGMMIFSFVDLAEMQDSQAMKILWQEISKNSKGG